MSRYKIYLSVLILTSLLLGGVLFAMPFLTKELTNRAVSSDYKMFITLVIILIATVFGRIILRFTSAYIGRRFGTKIEMRMREDAYKKMYKLKQEYFDVNDPGSLISKVIQDPRIIYYASFSIISESIFAFLGFAGGITFAFLNSWVIGVSIICIYVIGLLVTYLNAKRLVKIQYENKLIYSKMNASTTGQASAISEIKSYNAYKYEQQKNDKLNVKFKEKKLKVAFLQSSFQASSLGVALIIQTGVLLVAGFQLYHGNISIASFAAFLTLASMLIMPINRITGLFNMISDGISSIKRFSEFMGLPEEKWNGKEFIPGNGEIEFKNVNFSYVVDGIEKEVLKDFNLKIKKGQKVAFVGRSGIGKSTILKIILGFYEIKSGQILIDGQDIKKVNINNVREKISYIQQNGIIFDGTLKDNIKYKNKETNDEKIIEVIESAQLSDLIKNNKDGIHMKVGSNGAQLSGGQKQRVSIARAMVEHNNIILMDEATSSLDNNTEKNIKESVDILFKGKTTITVAHRLSTIINSDIIYYLEEGGKIAESGSYNELIKKRGFLYKLTIKNNL